MKKIIKNLAFILFSVILIACARKDKLKEKETLEMKIVTTTYNDTVYYENGEMKIVSNTFTDTLYLQKPE